MEPTVFLAFAYGLGGSLVVEVVLFLRAIGPRGSIPLKYKSKPFWFLRVFLALLSGGLATAYFAPQVPFYLYVHMGAATPALMLRASKVSDDDEPDQKPGQDQD